MEYGLLAQEDYKKTGKGKFGVFPLDWLIISNAENLLNLKFNDNKIKKKVRSIFI